MSKSNSTIMSLASEVSQVSGVQLGDRQKSMVVQRLRRRMTLLGLNDEAEYIEYYLRNRESEFRELISLFTTHHTYFFREFKHFEVLRNLVLPALISEVRQRQDKTIYLWSAACSRGQEVYSLAIFMELALKELAPDLGFHICGTDIDTISVEFAKNAVFNKKEIDSIPLAYLTGSFVRGKGEYSNFAKVHPRLHARCSFQYANLLDSKTWPKHKFDVIFCRNVFIYFSLSDIEKISLGFKKIMSAAGTLFLGLTETLNGLNVKLKNIGPSVYSMKNEVGIAKVTPIEVKKAQPRLQRVLCVDDSPTILSLLKQIFSRENGFVVADTAVNGQEAMEKIKTQKYDLVTLDIHMPIMTGLEFMRQSQGLKLPPVIVISSVDRQEKSLALEMLRLGALDYIEKPSLKDFRKRQEEILLKARTLVLDKKEGDYKKTTDPVFSSDRTLASTQKLIIGLFKEADSAVAASYSKMTLDADLKSKMISTTEFSLPIAELKTCDAIVVLSPLSLLSLEKIRGTGKPVFLLEDVYRNSKELVEKDFELFPMASLNYGVGRYLRGRRDE